MKDVVLILKGVMIGISTLIPGASGGTMAIILGVYDRMIHAVSSFFKEKRSNFLFLVKIGAGTLAGMLLFSRVIHYGLLYFYFPMISLFLGMICGGIPVLLNRAKSAVSRKRDYIFSFLGFAIALSMLLQPPELINLANARDAVGYLFLCGVGVIVSVALVLPGISASFMLLALGIYETTFLEAMQTLNLAFLLPLFAGVGLGTVCTAKILERVLFRYPRKTYLLILGFIIGSVVTEIVKQTKGEKWPPGASDFVFSAVAMLAGFVVIQLVNRFSSNGQAAKSKNPSLLSMPADSCREQVCEERHSEKHPR